MHLLASLVVLGERCRLQKKKSGTSAFRMRESLAQTDVRSAKSIPLPFEELSSALSTQDELQHFASRYNKRYFTLDFDTTLVCNHPICGTSKLFG